TEPSTLTSILSLGGRGGREAPGEGDIIGKRTRLRSSAAHQASRSKSKNKTEKIEIVGPVCESGDFFALDREMPEINEGDLLAIMSAGAYGFVMASNYNSRPSSAEALVHGDKVSLIRERQTWEDLVRGEVEPL